MIVDYDTGVDNAAVDMHDSSEAVATTEGLLYNIVACCLQFRFLRRSC